MFFKVSDLIERLTEIANDGYETVNIDLIEADDDLPAAITFEVIANKSLSIEYDVVDAIED